MRAIAIAVMVLTATLGAARADDADALVAQAGQAYAQKDYARSADLFAAAIAAGADDAGTFYDAACSHALAGRADPAFALLERAVAAGFTDVDHAGKDPDLASLRGDPRWGKLLERAATAGAARKDFWNGPTFATPYRPELPEDERIAGLSRVWAEVKYNFANFDLVPGLDWDALYAANLPRVRQARDTLEYYRILMEMVARLEDGHSNVYPPEPLIDEVYARPALRTGVVEGRVVVVRVLDDALLREGLAPGVEVVAVDGIPALEYGRTRVAPYQSASTPQDLEVRTFNYALLSGPASKPVELTLRPAKGATFTRALRRLPRAEAGKLPGSPPFELRMLPGKIAHVSLNSFGSMAAAEQLEQRFAEIAAARALILDVRENGGGNSSVGWRVLASLTDKPFATSAWRTRDYRPAYRAWGRPERAFRQPAGTVTPSGKLLFSGPVVVLTSARTFSAAEDFAVAFDAMKRGTLVGEPTGGSTGQPLMFDLPGGGRGRVCSKRDTYPDGKEFVGVGVQPGVLVRPTLADLRAGRDTVLEAARAFLVKRLGARR